MPERSQSAFDSQDKKGQPATESKTTKPPDGASGLAALLSGPMSPAGDGAIQRQAARLRNPQLQGAQRRGLAAQIGRVQGNRHLQQVVASLRPPAVQLTPQRRSSLGLSWYVEMDPPTSVVPTGTTVTFRLKNDADQMIGAWQREAGETEERPVVGVRVSGGPTRTWYPVSPNYPIAFRRTFQRPGHVEVFFRGRPMRGAGPGLAIPGSQIYVSVELDIATHLTRATMESERRRATYREDVNRLEDPAASEPEIAQAFQRVAVRYGIDLVNRNKQEAWDLNQMYTRGAQGRTATEATAEIQRILQLDAQLGLQISHLRSHPQLIVQVGGREAALQRIRDLNLVRASLIDAFPAMALIGRGAGPSRSMFARSETGQAQQILQRLLRRILRDCDSTRRALATGDLHIFDVDRVVQQTRQSMGIDADPRKRRAVDNAISRHHRSSMATALGLAGASIVLLFVPGLGPYLAAAVGLAGAGISWERAMDLQTGARAGVRQGVVGQGAAAAATFWAAIETLLAGLDVAQAVRPLARIAPHVPAAANRLIPRAARAPARAAAALPPRAAMAPLEASHPLNMTADELSDFCARLFRRPIPQMRGRAHFYGSWADYAAEYRRVYPRARFPDPIPGGGYLNPNTGQLHVSPRGDLLTSIHEAIHLVANDINPLGRQLLGDFLDEGITEAITRARLGPLAGRHGYDAHVTFVRLLQAKVGRDVVENAVLHGAYRPLRDAVRRALGGSEARTHEFFSLLRRIGSSTEGGVSDPDALSRAIDLVGSMGGAP
jgi:transposase